MVAELSMEMLIAYFQAQCFQESRSGWGLEFPARW